MRRRAFTLLELSIALAMAGIVVAAAAATGVTVSRILKLEAKKSHADADSRRLVDFVLSNLQAVGGGPVRPWMAAWVEPQNCLARPNGSLGACDGRNDRLTLVDVDFNRGSCTMQSMTSTQIVFQPPDPVTGTASPRVARPTSMPGSRSCWSRVAIAGPCASAAAT
jgi:prepilin-type N-terminal cleavage/methylation domain-containing protein